MDIFLLTLFFILVFGLGILMGGIVLLLTHDYIFYRYRKLFPIKDQHSLLIEATNANKNGMFICTVGGDIVFANDSFCSMIEHTKKEVMGMSFIENTPERFREQDRYFLDKSINDGLNTFEIRKNFNTQSDSEVPVILQVSALRNSKGSVTFYIVNVQLDKITNDNIVLNHRYFESAFDNSKIGMAVVTPTGMFLRANQELANMLGYTQSELQRKTFQEITHKDDLRLDLDYANKVMRKEIDTYMMDKRYIRKDGEYVPVMLSVSGVYDSDNEITSFIAQVQLNTGRINDDEYLSRA